MKELISSGISSKIIIDSFVRNSIRVKKANRIFKNVYISHWEADILEVTVAGYQYEYEVKISRSDFANDSKKCKTYFNSNKGILKHDILQQGKRTNYFYFVVPDGLVKASDVPEWAGLIYFKQIKTFDMFDQVSFVRNEFKTVKKAKLLHRNKITNKQLIKLYESIYFKFYRK